MRLGATEIEGTSYPYVLSDGSRYPMADRAGSDVGALVELGPDELLELSAAAVVGTAEEGVLLAPLRPGKIVAIGLNYMDHVRETGMDAPSTPLVFAKFPSSLVADGQPIRVDGALTQRVDWEVELAVVIGERCRRIKAADAQQYIFGYTVANDVSARDLQFGDGQWVRGKSLDGFCPLGPHVVTVEEIPDPQALQLRTTVNGAVVQNSSTAEMIFGVFELIEYCSHSFTLEPGDVILTGTPWGCGEFMDPRRSLEDGDVVAVSVDGIGTVTNRVEIY
jgi:5-carboxymethyl-2-hydroxymuconate isomerase